MRNKKDNKIRLLILVKSIDGGTGTFLLNLLNIKKIFGKDQIVIKTLVLERPSYRNVENHQFIYLRKKDFYPQKYSFSPFNFLNFFQELAWILKKNSTFKFTHVISIDMRCNLLAIILKILSPEGIKVVATNHIDLGTTISHKSTKLTTIFLWYAIRLFYDKADALVCVSKSLSKNLKKNFGLKKKVFAVYNGLNLKPGKARAFSQGKKKTIITVARLVEQKDYITLLKSFKLIQRQLPDTNLWIASDGPQKKMLKSYARNLNLQSKVQFLGWVKNLNLYLRKADIFVLSSKREGFGYVLVEAMSQGLPVVSTDTPYGPSEILGSGKYGVLVPPGNSILMKKEIISLLTNRGRYEDFSRKAIERSTYFNQERMINGYKKIITNLS